MRRMNIRGLSASLGMVVAFASSSYASPLLNESFDQYPNATVLTATGNYTAFSGGGTLALTANSGTTTVTNVASGTSGEDDRNTFTNTPINTGLLYLSTLVTVPTGTGTLTANGDYFLSLYGSQTTGGGYLARIFLSATATGTAFGLSNSGAAPVDGADITLGTQYKLVMRLDLTARTATLGVFTVGTAVTADSQLTIADATAGTTSTAGINSVALRQGSGTAFTAVIDGMQIGTTLADVAGITTGPSTYFSAIPEPSTYAMGMARANSDVVFVASRAPCGVVVHQKFLSRLVRGRSKSLNAVPVDSGTAFWFSDGCIGSELPAWPARLRSYVGATAWHREKQDPPHCRRREAHP